LPHFIVGELVQTIGKSDQKKVGGRSGLNYFHKSIDFHKRKAFIGCGFNGEQGGGL